MSSQTFKAFAAGLLCFVMTSQIAQATNSENAPEIASIVKPVKMAVVPATYRSQSYSFVATVSATERAQLAFQVPGQIRYFKVRMGEVVQKGDLLASLDPTDYQLAVDARQAEYDLQQARLKRAQQLYDKALISENDLDLADTLFTAAQASLEQAVTDLANSELHAPFSGRVAYTQAKAHQVVGANQPILHLLGPGRLDLNFDMPVAMADKIDVDHLINTELSVTLGGFKDIELPAEFKEIATQPDADTNSFAVTLTIDRPQHLNILPGMSGVVYVKDQNAPTQAFELDKSAFISHQEQQARVWRVDPESNLISEVSITVDSSGKVLSGLNPGDQIVAAGAKELVAGQKVRLWEKEGGI